MFYTFVGNAANVMARSRIIGHKPSIVSAIGQFHVEYFAEGLDDVDEAALRLKIKNSGGVCPYLFVLKLKRNRR